MLFLYNQWYQLLVCIKGLFSQDTTYLYPSFQGYIRFVSLLFPLICPCKVVHDVMVHTPVAIYNPYESHGQYCQVAKPHTYIHT